MYKIAYIMMLVGFGYLSASAPDIRGKIIGLLCFLLNGVIFWK